MASPTQKIAIWWDGLQPRERNMMAILGITAVICVLGFGGKVVQDGLDKIDERNGVAREALTEIHKHRIAKARGDLAKSKKIEIPSEAKKIDLESFLEKASKEVGVSFPKYNRNTSQRGDFEEETGRIELKDVSILELKEFLHKIEANPMVVVLELRVKQDFRDKEKLDVPEILVATYYRKDVPAVLGESK